MNKAIEFVVVTLIAVGVYIANLLYHGNRALAFDAASIAAVVVTCNLP